MSLQKYVYVGLLVFIFTSQAWANSWVDSMKREFSKQELHHDIDLFDSSYFDGKFHPSFNCGLRSQPSYINGQYLHVDNCRIQMPINPFSGVALGDTALSLGMTINPQLEIMFVRQFEKQLPSIFAVGPDQNNQKQRGPRIRFPHNSEYAKKLEPGQLVVFKTRLDLILSLSEASKVLKFNKALVESKLKEAAKSFGVSANLNFGVSLSGEYIVHIYKMKNDRVRVKFFANLAKNRGVSAGLGFSLLNPINLVGIQFVDRYLQRRVLGTIPISINYNDADNKIYVLDYVFNLQNPEAASAYNDMMKPKFLFKSFDLIKDSFSNISKAEKNDQVEKGVFADFAEINRIYHEDIAKNLPAKERRINRVFNGLANSNSRVANFAINLLFFKYQISDQRSKLRLETVENNNGTDEVRNYLYDTGSIYKNLRFIGNILNSNSETKSLNLLIKADSNYQPKELSSLVLIWNKQKGNFDRSEYIKTQQTLTDLFPQFPVNWSPYPQKTATSAFINTELILQLPELKKHYRFSYNEISNKLIAFLNLTSYPNVSRKSVENNYCSNESSSEQNSRCTEQEFFANDIELIGRYLSQLLSSYMYEAQAGDDQESRLAQQDEINQSIRAFDNLLSIPLFNSVANDFLIYLLPKTIVQDAVHFRFELNARGISPAINEKWPKGSQPIDRLKRDIEYLQNVIFDRSFDLRLYEDDAGELSPKPIQGKPQSIIVD